MSSPYYLRKKPSPNKSSPEHNSPSTREVQRKRRGYTDRNGDRNGDTTGDEDDSTSLSELDSSSISKSGYESLNTSKGDKGSARTRPSNRDTKKEASPVSKTSTKRENRNDKGKKSESSTSWFANFLFIFVFMAGVAWIASVLIENQSISSPSENRPDLIETFYDQMKTLQTMFPTQTSRFWKILKVSLRRIIVDNPAEYPSVLLLVVPSGSRSSEMGTCIAKHLTRTINTLFNVTSAKVINIPRDITHSDPDAEKKDLDDQIRDSFENQHFRSIAFDHFEQLSPRASLLFHGYCDGDNAPFKNVAIVFVLHTDFDKESLQNDRIGTLVDGHLIDLWSRTAYPLDRDKIDPLIARVANNAAIVTEDVNLKCK